MHWDTFQQTNYSTEGGDGGCRVGEVRAGITSPMPAHKGFKYSNYQRSTHSIISKGLLRISLTVLESF